MECRILKHIILRDRMLMTRLGLAVGSLFWSFQLLTTWMLSTIGHPPISSLSGRHTYSLMEFIAPIWVWGLLFLLHSGTAFSALFRAKRSRILTFSDSLLGMLVWTASTVACYLSHWDFGVPFIVALQHYTPPAAMSGSSVLVLYAWWHLLRLWEEEENPKLPCSH
jgi:hypothetical protein